MEEFTIRIASSEADLRRISPVLLQLRPAFTEDALIAQIREQQLDGFQLAYLSASGAIACVAGFRIGLNLAWGKHMYVDDLVTAEAFRSTGAGARMMAWLQRHALDEGCGQLHLDSGVQRFRAHRFYLREGFSIASHHFSITELGRRGGWSRATSDEGGVQSRPSGEGGVETRPSGEAR